jgi:two-component system CheB/CheR fusion protein
MKAHLRHTVEQHEASIEELKASNEELQAMNEELRAATEELETSREELQSINEELSTVNAEMKGKVEDIVQANSDLQNLMGSISAATVFLDVDLLVTLYTPSAIDLFHFIPTDVGRPLTDLSQRLVYPQLPDDARQVLRTLVPVVREVGDAQGRWFLARVQPYRTQDERIAGVVLTFTDITEHRAQQAAHEEGRVGLESQQRRFDNILGALPDSVFTLDAGQRFVYAGPGVARLFGTTTRRIVGLTVREAGCPAEVATRIEGWVRQVLETGEPVGGADGEIGRIGAEGRFDFIFAPLRNAEGAIEGVVGWSRGSHASGSPNAI